MNRPSETSTASYVLWSEAGRATALGYTEQTVWMPYLKNVDDLEYVRTQETELRGQRCASTGKRSPKSGAQPRVNRLHDGSPQ